MGGNGITQKKWQFFIKKSPMRASHFPFFDKISYISPIFLIFLKRSPDNGWMISCRLTSNIRNIVDISMIFSDIFITEWDTAKLKAQGGHILGAQKPWSPNYVTDKASSICFLWVEGLPSSKELSRTQRQFCPFEAY